MLLLSAVMGSGGHLAGESRSNREWQPVDRVASVASPALCKGRCAPGIGACPCRVRAERRHTCLI